MTRVIRIAREYIIPVQRYVFDDEGSSAFDSWVMDYILQHADLERITLADIKRSARRQFEHGGIDKNSWTQNEWIFGAMYVLENMKWVARFDDGSKETQGKAEWLINPMLKTTFKAYRDAVVRAKAQRNADRLEKAGSTRPNVTHGADSLDDVT